MSSNLEALVLKCVKARTAVGFLFFIAGYLLLLLLSVFLCVITRSGYERR